MDGQIGSVFRETRNRRKIDLSEVEAATRIRVRDLRAIENEEWDVLPGHVYARGFIRTYASFLGLDGERLSEDYRRDVECGVQGAAVEPTAAAAPSPTGRPRRGWISSGRGWIAVAGVILVAILVIVAIPGGGGSGGEPTPKLGHAKRRDGNRQGQSSKPQSSKDGVSVRLAASAEVWVCVLDGRGRALVDGQILEAGEEEGPFRSGSFTVSFGNGEVSMLVDGREAEIPVTSSPIGYSIDRSGALTDLSEAERPTCS
jgi:cytoskeleton protein RodZ